MGIENPIQQRTERTVGTTVVDGRTDNESVDTVPYGTHHLEVKVVVEGAAPRPSAHATGDAALHRFLTNTDDFGLYTLLVQGLCHFGECRVGVPLLAWASVDK